MTWLTWRQIRGSAVATYSVLRTLQFWELGGYLVLALALAAACAYWMRRRVA